MNVTHLINYLIDTNLTNTSFEQTIFRMCPQLPQDIGDFVKLTISDMEKVMLQGDQSNSCNNQKADGGVSKSKRSAKSETWHQSYSEQFPQIIQSYVALIGFETSRSLASWMAMKGILVRIMGDIKKCSDHASLLGLLKYARMIIEFSINNNIFDEVNYDGIVECVNMVEKEQRDHNKAYFTRHCDDCRQALNMIVNNIITQSITIDSIDKLIVSLGRYDILYTGSFLKLHYDVLNESNSVNIESLLGTLPDFTSKFCPNMSTEIEIMHQKLSRYFNTIMKNTITEIEAYNQSRELVDVSITGKLVSDISWVVINTLLLMSKNIIINQRQQVLHNRTSRANHAQVMAALDHVIPSYNDYTNAMRSSLHFILLPSSVIQESIKVVLDKN